MIASQAVDGFLERAILLDYLELANAHLAENEERIAQQRRLLSLLDGDDSAVIGARKFLRALQMVRTAYESQRIRLEQELATAKPEYFRRQTRRLGA